MNKNKILLSSTRHILDSKLYEILKRNNYVEVLDTNIIKNNREYLYKSVLIDKNYWIFSTESVWEYYLMFGLEQIKMFFEKMLAVSLVENIKVIYIFMDAVLEKEYLIRRIEEDTDKFDTYNKFLQGCVARSDKNVVLSIPAVYGNAKEPDIIDLIAAKEVNITNLNIKQPLLADKVAVYINENLENTLKDMRCITVEKNFRQWFLENFDKDYRPTSEETVIRYRQRHCVFDFVYKLEPYDTYRDCNVAQKRIELGKKLASSIPVDIVNRVDFVTPVPRTGLYYAMGLSESLKIPYIQALIKGTYNERSFSMLNTDDRKKFLWDKIRPIPTLLKGKRIIVVDEAVFTGITLKIICEMLRKCEVEEIYLGIPTPPCIYHCNYLVHPQRKMLLEYMSVDYLKKYFDVTNIFFQKESCFREFNYNMDEHVCLECFVGE